MEEEKVAQPEFPWDIFRLLILKCFNALLQSTGSIERIEIDKPLFDQSTFYGRFQHFFFVTDPR